MSQKLLLPFNKNLVFASYKTKAYREQWGYDHYGIDIGNIWIGGDGKILSSGNGYVVGCGNDEKLGYGVAIYYPMCYNRITKEEKNLIIRYMHMDKIYVKINDSVTINTLIGHESNIGTQDPHLHIECDTDIKYPLYSPQVAGKGRLWKKGVDSSVNISEFMHQSSNRYIVKANESNFILDIDKSYPVIDNDNNNMYYTVMKNIKSIIDELI